MRIGIQKTHRYLLVTAILVFVLHTHETHCIRQGLIVNPVADLVGSPIKQYFPQISTHKAYKQIPLNRGLSKPALECPRLHQALFNETVEIVEERETEALIKVPNAFYLADDTLKNEYWIQKNAFIRYDTLKKNGVDVTKIPPMSSKHNQAECTSDVITLKMPLYDSEKQISYSAGTRFVMAPEQSNEQNVAVYIFDPANYDFAITNIPRAITSTHGTPTKQEQIAHCIATIQQWANISDGFIPYVWGGCSFTHTSNAVFNELSIVKKGTPHSYVNLDDFSHATKPGFDCSNMILRAAHIAGIPYYYKNSSAAAKYLKILSTDDSVEAGDIIWIPGHVMMVSDVKNNLLVEARGYNHGYGRIQEMELSKVFKNIKTYDNLAKALHRKQKLYRLDNKGVVADSFTRFKILKMKSVWD